MRAREAAQAWSAIEQVDRARWGPSVKPLDVTALPAPGRLTTNSHLRCFQVRAEITFNRVPRSSTPKGLHVTQSASLWMKWTLVQTPPSQINSKYSTMNSDLMKC